MSNLLSIDTPGIKVKPNGLTIPESTTKQTWADIGKKLVHAGNSFRWLQGDWAEFGLTHFPEAVKPFCDIHGLDYGTTRNLAHVSRSFSAERRRQKLGWAYHAEAAQMRLFPEQEKWLTQAETDKLSVGELRQLIRKSQGEFDSSESDGKGMKFACRSCDELVAFLESRTAEFWDDTRRKVWASRLQPIVDCYQTLIK